MIKIGDKIIIIDSTGNSYGKNGDIVKVTKSELTTYGQILITGILQNGKHKGKLTSRFDFRFKKVQQDWDE